MKEKEIVIDASGAVLGRMAAFAAKKALLGNNVVIVNCNDILLTGNRKSIIREYYDARKKGGASLKGPFFPKHPYRIVKRTIRGMLNYQQGRGLKAFKRVMCHDSVPKEYENTEKVSLKMEIRTTSMKLNELAR